MIPAIVILSIVILYLLVRIITLLDYVNELENSLSKVKESSKN